MRSVVRRRSVWKDRQRQTETRRDSDAIGQTDKTDGWTDAPTNTHPIALRVGGLLCERVGEKAFELANEQVNEHVNEQVSQGLYK